MKKLLRGAGVFILAILVILVDLILLRYFNTLIWPYFWPLPAFIVLTIGLTVAIWFPQFGYSIWMLRIIGLLLIFIGQSYVIHSFQVMTQRPSLISAAHFIGITGMVAGLMLNYVNQVNPKNRIIAPPLPYQLPQVAVVIPTYGEPYEVLERTLVSIKRVDYPQDRLCVVLSDDGRRPEIRKLAEIYGAYYNYGPQKDAKAGNLNSALAFLESTCPQASLVLTQDADEIVHPDILRKTVGYFTDPAIAFVQTPKEVVAPKGDPFGTRDRIFYDNLQVGRNGAGAAFACGSGVIWRINAVKSIGGFVTWNVVEDLTTSYWLHSAGYKSEYHNECLSVGLAPDDIPGLLKQRGTWAVDTWRLFLFDNPLFKPGLTFWQRLQYLELGMFYVMSSFFIPLLMFVPLASLATGEFIPISGAALFPWILICFLYYVILSGGSGLYTLRMWQYWIGHWPTFHKAFWIALRSRLKKPKYMVTRKTRDAGFYPNLLWQHFVFLILGIVLSLRALFFMPEIDLGTRLANIGIIAFFIFMASAIVKAAFFGVDLPFTRWITSPKSKPYHEAS
jgi:cellulose synthase (UDP-forming)